MRPTDDLVVREEEEGFVAPLIGEVVELAAWNVAERVALASVPGLVVLIGKEGLGEGGVSTGQVAPLQTPSSRQALQ